MVKNDVVRAFESLCRLCAVWNDDKFLRWLHLWHRSAGLGQSAWHWGKKQGITSKARP